MRLAAKHTFTALSSARVLSPGSGPHQARQDGWVLKCEPGTWSNNTTICPGNAHIHLTKHSQAGKRLRAGRRRGIRTERKATGIGGRMDKQPFMCTLLAAYGNY